MSAKWRTAGTVFGETDAPTQGPDLGAPSRPPAGTIIHGAYRVVEELATGGMGVVMLARDEQLDRDVAIKFVRQELLADEGLRARFVSEARAMARVRHPNVVQIYAFGQHESVPYFVMEFVKGQTVQALLRSWSSGVAPPDLPLALRLLDETCKGVEAIHAAGTVHRDLKPSNLLLDSSRELRVTDFGVADRLQRRGVNGELQIVGTPEYMAPEIVDGSEIPPELSYRSDVYSLGCIAFELLTGTPPFAGESTVEQMVARVVQEPPRPSARRPDLTTAFDDVVLRALDRDPATRTPTAEAFRRALRAAADQTSEPVRILVADDDEDFRQLLSTSLQRELPGVEIECVSEGSAALAAFDAKRPSVAIIDLQMPGIDGMELTSLLRGRQGAQAMPIIVITASGGASEWKRLAAMGADGFLVKPFNVKDVVTLVRRALGDRRTVPPPIFSPP
ncbi:MAG: protein kinase [Myxococcales bacterium]|nr:protein kinase [Myxococcales bacterium]